MSSKVNNRSVEQEDSKEEEIFINTVSLPASHRSSITIHSNVHPLKSLKKNPGWQQNNRYE